MRLRHAVFIGLTGTALCTVFIALQQSVPSVEQLRLGSNDHNEAIIDSGQKSFLFESLRYKEASGRSTPIPARVRRKQLSVTLSSNMSPSLRKKRRQRFSRRTDQPAPNWITSLYYDIKSPPVQFQTWKLSTFSLCSSPARSPSSELRNVAGSQTAWSHRFVAYNNMFAELHDVIVDQQYFRAARKGGEMVDDVIGQEELTEYYTIDPGCFLLTCKQLPRQSDVMQYWFVGDSHLNRWWSGGLKLVDRYGGGLEVLGDEPSEDQVVFDGFTVAVVRYEYANLYHTTTDWYNVFLMMQFFERTPAETNILLVDAHPVGALDSVWMRLFGSVIRLSALKKRTMFRHLVWNIVGYDGPMETHADTPYPPLFDEFRHHVLSSYNIDPSPNSTNRNCSALKVLFIWRRDYLAHPRNPSGHVQRKIANERELVERVQRRYPQFRITGVQIDLLDFGDQLRRFVEADIVVGIHGAGLTHAAFMRSDAGLAEICPNPVWAGSEHFEAIAKWRKLAYVRWINYNMELEDELAGTVRIPPYIASALVSKLARRICGIRVREPTVDSQFGNDRLKNSVIEDVDSVRSLTGENSRIRSLNTRVAIKDKWSWDNAMVSAA